MATKTKHDWLAERAKIVRSSNGFALEPAAKSLGLNADETWLDNPYREIGIAVSGDNQAGSPNLATLTAQVEQYKARAEKERSRRLVEQRNKLSEERKRQDAEFEAEDEKQRRAIAENQKAQARQEQARAEREADEQARKRQVAEAQVEAQKRRRAKAESDADEALSIAKSASSRAAKVHAENRELKSQNNRFQSELEAKKELIKVLDVEADEVPDLSPNNRVSVQRSLRHLVGKGQSISVKGHARRVLALRLGIALPETATRADVRILEDMRHRGRYRVEFARDGKTGIAVLDFDERRQQIFAKTFYNERSDWFQAEQAITGVTEAGLKDRYDLTLDQFVIYHEKIVQKLESL